MDMVAQRAPAGARMLRTHQNFGHGPYFIGQLLYAISKSSFLETYIKFRSIFDTCSGDYKLNQSLV